MSVVTTRRLSPPATRHSVVWVVAAVVFVAAAVVVARTDTPIDEALPFVVLVITAIAAVTRPAAQLSIPLLLGGSIALPDERQRLLWFGLVVAAAFAVSIHAVAGRAQAVTVTVAAVLLLRWIPLEEVMPGRELMILALAAATVLILGSTPAAIAVATVAALFTPAVPLRTLLMPAAVLVLAMLVRVARLHRVRLNIVGAGLVAVMMTFFAWSGALARALPLMLRGGPPELQRVPVNIALPPGAAAEVDIPPGARGLILSGANVPRLKRGTVMGRIQPGDIVVRIGDVADWGVLRREHYYNSLNPLPPRPGGIIRGYGQTAWIDASGRIAVPPGRVVVTADPALPPRASLQIDAIELSR